MRCSQFFESGGGLPGKILPGRQTAVEWQGAQLGGRANQRHLSINPWLNRADLAKSEGSPGFWQIIRPHPFGTGPAPTRLLTVLKK
jgi:hypothetical protein